MRFVGAVSACFLALAACASPPPPPRRPFLPDALSVQEDPLVAEEPRRHHGLCGPKEFSGTVLVAKDGKPVFREAFGLANRELMSPMLPERSSASARSPSSSPPPRSCSWSEQGKLSIDDPVSKYYANAPAAWSKVTVRHLLTHRSGIPSYTGLPASSRSSRRSTVRHEEIVELTQTMPLEFEPGTKFAYNNTGYVLLGYIIEKVSGQTYADYLRAHIFKPLGLKHTATTSRRTFCRNRAAGYGFDNGVWFNADLSLDVAAARRGLALFHVDDLLLWEEAFFGGKVVSAASLDCDDCRQGESTVSASGPTISAATSRSATAAASPASRPTWSRFPDDGTDRHRPREPGDRAAPTASPTKSPASGSACRRRPRRPPSLPSRSRRKCSIAMSASTS